MGLGMVGREDLAHPTRRRGYNSIMPDPDHDDPRLAIRRHTDRCFHRVEEIVPGKMGGYIVEGILILREDVAEIRGLDDDDQPPACVDSTGK